MYEQDEEPLPRSEALFAALLTDRRLVTSGLAEGEWRYAFTEQTFDPAGGTYSDAVPARAGGIDLNYATELSGREVQTPALVWLREKGLVEGEVVYEFDGSAAGVFFSADTDWSFDASTWAYYDSTYFSFYGDVNYTFYGTVYWYFADYSYWSYVTADFFYADCSFYYSSSLVVYTDVTLIYDGDTTVTYDAPVKFYDGWWLHYRTRDLSGSATWNDLALDADAADRVVVRFELDRDTTLTGIVAVPDGGSGQVLWLLNVDATYDLTLAHESASSAAANRFSLPGLADLVLSPSSGAVCWYDAADSRWRVVGFCCDTGGGASTFSGARVYRSAGAGNQTIAASTDTNLNFDAERYDTDSFHDNATNNTRLTIPADGYYHVGFWVRWAASTASGSDYPSKLYSRIRLNATTTILEVGDVVNSTGNSAIGQTGGCDYFFSAGDYVEVQVNQNSTGGMSNLPTSLNEFWIHKIG